MIELLNTISANISVSASPHAIAPFGIILASLIGSGHCMVMCGPIIAATTRSPKDIFIYNIARGISYILVGVMAGYLGQWINIQHYDWIQTATRLFIGLNLILIASFNIAKRPFHFSVPPYLKFRFVESIRRPMHQLLSRMLSQTYKTAHTHNTPYAVAMVGASSIFLPCGWLYTAILAAVSTGSWWMGGIVMMCFWIGSLPAMLSTAHLIQTVLSPVKQRWNGIANLLLVIIGIWFLM